MAQVVDLTATDDAPEVSAVVDLTADDVRPVAGATAGLKRPRARAADDVETEAPSMVGKGLASLNRTNVAEQLTNLLSCPVCLDAPMTEMSVTLCGHLFCGPCIAKVIEVHKLCPTCKAKLKKNSAHRVFL